jgi:hypothetical protein
MDYLIFAILFNPIQKVDWGGERFNREVSTFEISETITNLETTKVYDFLRRQL